MYWGPEMKKAEWKSHKEELFALAAQLGAEVGQSQDGRPTIRYPPSGPKREYPTWLAALSWLRDCARDQRTPQEVPYALPYHPPDPSLVRWICPTCQTHLSAPREARGMLGLCRACRTRQTVP